LKKRILDHLSKEVNCGRLIGPLPNYKPSFLDHLSVSPISLLEKRSMGMILPGKYRLIHDLSHGKIFSNSVNNFIDKDEFNSEYLKFVEFCETVRSAGIAAEIWKNDQTDAFRIAPIHPDDIPLLAFSFMGNLYLESRLVFGVTSGPGIFGEIAMLVRMIFQEMFLARRLRNYLDDFLNVTHRNHPIASAVSLIGFKDFALILGIELAADKTLGPSTTMTVLGLEIDTVLQQVRVPPQRLEALKLLLQAWSLKKEATKQEFQSLIGVLQFCCYGVRWGRSFLRRLITTMASLSLQSDSAEIDADARADIEWWSKFMLQFSGVTYLINPLPTSEECHFFSDSSNPCCAGVWQDSWWFYMFTKEDEANLPHISCKELFAVVTQCATFGPKLCGKTIVLWCDNSASVDAIVYLRAKDPVMTKLVRELFYLCATYSFQVQARHVEGIKNTLADCLSRPDLRHLAWRTRPSLDRVPLKPTLPTLKW